MASKRKAEGMRERKYREFFLFFLLTFPPSSHEKTRRLGGWVNMCGARRRRCLSSVFLLAKHRRRNWKKFVCVGKIFTLHFSLLRPPLRLRWCISMFVDALHKLLASFLLLLGGGWEVDHISHHSNECDDTQKCIICRGNMIEFLFYQNVFLSYNFSRTS